MAEAEALAFPTDNSEDLQQSEDDESLELGSDISDGSDEVSLMVVDEAELTVSMKEAGVSIKAVDDDSGAFEVEVLRDDVSTFLVLAPEDEYLGAKVQGFIPRDDGGLSALEMHGQLVEGDVLTHLNGNNAREMDFCDILKACRDPERGGLPRPLTLRFSRSETLAPLPSPPTPVPSAAAVGVDGRVVAKDGNGSDGAKPDSGGGSSSGGGGGGASSLLEDLMGGLNLSGFNPTDAVLGPLGQESGSGTREGSTESRRLQVPGMAQLKDAFRTELQAQGMLGGGDGESRTRGLSLGSGGGGGGDRAEGAEGGAGNGNRTLHSSASVGEGIFLNMLRKLESIDVLGEDNPPGSGASRNGGGHVPEDAGGSSGGGDDGEGGGVANSKGQGRDGGVGSSLAGVGAKLRSKFRKPGGFGLPGSSSAGSGGGSGEDATDLSGKAFVEGASKALAMNRERVMGVMGWMKELRPKDWSPKHSERRAEEESRQELRAALHRLYLDAPDPPVHTARVVARARTAGTEAPRRANIGAMDGHAAGSEVNKGREPEAGRVIGTGADKRLVKISWFRSSSRDGFAEIDGVDGAYYQLSADDIGSHICVKCSLASSHASLSPARQTNSRGGGRAGGAPAAVTPDGSRHQAVAFAEVGPIVLDPVVGAEVDALLSGDKDAAFWGLERRDKPGETSRVCVEVGVEQVRVLREAHDWAPTNGNRVGQASQEAGCSVASDEDTQEVLPMASAEPAAPTGGAPPESLPGDSNGKISSDGLAKADALESKAVEGTVVAEGVSAGGVRADNATSAKGLDEGVPGDVIVEGRYSDGGVLVALDPARPLVLKVTMHAGGEEPTTLILRAVDGRQRDVLALTLRGRRQSALGPEVIVDDFPEATRAKQAKENYLELKAAAAHFAVAYDDDDNSVSFDGVEDDNDGEEEEEEEEEDDGEEEEEEEDRCEDEDEGDGDGDEGELEGDEENLEDEEDSGSDESSQYSDEVVAEEVDYLGGARGNGRRTTSVDGSGLRSSRASVAGACGGDSWAARASLDGHKRRIHGETGAGLDGPAGTGRSSTEAAPPWEADDGVLDGLGGEDDGEPRSLSSLLEDLRQVRAVAELRGRQLKEAHALREAGEAGREKAEAELSLVSAELDLLRPLARSLAGRAEAGADAVERAEALAAEVGKLKDELLAAQKATEELTSRARTAEEQAGAKAGRLEGLEEVVRRMSSETETAQAELASERAGKEEALLRASRAERELDQARARAAVLDNKVTALEREKLEHLADANAAKARAEAISEQLKVARAAEKEKFTSRVAELEEKLSSLEGKREEAESRMREAREKQAEEEAKAARVLQDEARVRAELSAKAEQVLQLTAQRNSAKHRADSLAKDLSRLCGGGRTVDQIEAIVSKYADLKVKVAMMEAEKDGAIPDAVEAGGLGQHGQHEAAQRALRENTELKGRVAALTEALQMKGHQLEGQRQSNEFLLKRVEDLESQIAEVTGNAGEPPVRTD